MLYAKVVFGLAVDGAFDYIVPPSLNEKIRVGARVRVDFRNKEMTGYVVALSGKTNIKKLKVISELLDNSPVLDRNMLSLAKNLSEYYCCFWGEAIETALPVALRKGKRIFGIEQTQHSDRKAEPEAILLHDLDGKAKWDVYLTQIKNTVDCGMSVIVLLPDIGSAFKAREKIIASLGIQTGILYRRQPKELDEWLGIKKGKVNIAVGTRSAVFAPFNNLGLIIIDGEEDSVYKQDQVPHYNAREVAFMRINIEKAKLILGTSSPSLESFYLKKKKKIKYMYIARKRDFPEIKIIDSRLRPQNSKQRTIFSRYLEDSIASALNSGEKTLLFLNRRGFSTYALCSNCQTVLKCPRCNINLVYHFKENILNCHFCNFKMPAQKICPNCNSGYIRYMGTGTEKIESELSRLFPQAKIKLLDKENNVNTENADIFVSTESVIRGNEVNFGLIGVLSIDNSLNRIDFRSSEKAFVLLSGLLRIAEKKIIIQTVLPKHHCFASLEKNDINMFYEAELKQRKQLNFPPYSHIGLVKLRGEKENRVREISESLFSGLNRVNKDKKTEVVCVNPAQPSKLRGKYCWQILVKADSCRKLSRFLKIYLKGFSHSGIIVTIDVDPL